MVTGTWWEETERMYGINPKASDHVRKALCAFLIFSDASNMFKSDRHKAKVVMLGSGNLRTCVQRKLSARRFLGLIPELKTTKSQSKLEPIKRARKILHQQAMRIILEPIRVGK